MDTSIQLVPSEVLFFIQTTIDVHPASLIKKTVLGFHREDEIMSAKQLLVQAVENLKDIPLQMYLTHSEKVTTNYELLLRTL